VLGELSGAATCRGVHSEVRYRDQRAADASAGDVIMLNPGEMHDGMPLNGKARGWHIMYFDPALVAHEIEAETVGRAEIMLRPVAQDPLLARHVARLFACLTSSHPDSLATDENLLRSLIYVLRKYGTARCPSSGPSPCVAKARQLLDSAPDTPVYLAELAALSGVSRFQLLRGFAREVGITPHAYLVQRRVCLARQFLVNGHTPAQAAAQAGFADQSHMTRAFVRYLGITPGRYRAAIA
jgi:AraC-like DNA-binding protein